MLARHMEISDGRIYGNKRIHGKKELKAVFFGAAESALRTDTSLRRYYDTLRKKGLSHVDARVALARKDRINCSVLFEEQYHLQR